MFCFVGIWYWNVGFVICEEFVMNVGWCLCDGSGCFGVVCSVMGLFEICVVKSIWCVEFCGIG